MNESIQFPMNHDRNPAGPDVSLHAVTLGGHRWRLEQDAAGARALLSPPDWPAGEGTIVEERDATRGRVTYSATVERLATPRLLVRQDGFSTLEAAHARLAGDRFQLCAFDGITWVAAAERDDTWYAEIDGQRFVIERFVEPGGQTAYQVVRFPRGSRPSATVRSIGIASILSLAQAAAVAADFDACLNVPLSKPGPRRALLRKRVHV